VAFSPDGKKVVSGSYDSTMRVWDITTGQADQTYSGDITSMAFSLDGKKVVSNCSDSAVRVWDIATGQAEQTLKGGVGSVVLSPDGKVVLSEHWLSWNGSRILYLPYDLRRGVIDFSDNTFVIASRNGRVTIISYIPQD
jgi:WD40 repeat protein